MTLSGTWCGGSEVRFMSAVESVGNQPTKTTLESVRCDGLFKSNIHNRVGQGGASLRIRDNGSRQNSNCVVPQFCPRSAGLLVPERADQPLSASGTLAGISANSRIAARYALAKFSSTPTPSGS
jgi:hypothetical protein